MHLHKDKLVQKIVEQIQLLISNPNQPNESDQQFYDCFKYGIAQQYLSEIMQQVQTSSNIDQPRKAFSYSVFTKMSSILMNYQSQQYMVAIRINQQLHFLARDTIRIIQEVFEALQYVEKVQLCGKDASLKQYDKYMRQLDQLVFFWEQIHILENRPILFNKENISSQISQLLDQWLDILVQKLNFQQKSQTLKQAESSKPVQATNIQTQVDHRLRIAHEMFAGLGRDKDQIAAVQLYTKLAEENDATAQAIMGQIYLEGITCPKDYDQAFNYFKKSADQQNAFSLYHTSKLVFEAKVYDKFYDRDDNNTITSKNSSEAYNSDCAFALTLLKRAAELDHLESMIYLGDLYSNGLQLQDYTLERDYPNAEFYYKQAQNKNSSKAIHKLALLYLTMCKQSQYKNRSQLIQPLLTQAKNQDYLPAFYDLGQLLYQGLQDEIEQNLVMADLIFEQGCMKGDLRCAQKLLNLRFQALRKNEVGIDDFFGLLEQIEQENKDWTITYYIRGKVYEKGLQVEKNQKKAQEQYRLGYMRGCQKCRIQLDKNQKETMPTDNNPTNSQQSSLYQRQTINGFIEQIRQSERKKKPFQKQRQVSIGNVQSIFNNVENDIQSTIQDGHTRMTISITRPKNQTDDRKRGVSATELPLQDIGGSILLSQIKFPEKTHQHSVFWSPRQPSQYSQSGLKITNSTSKKRFNLNKIRLQSNIPEN
ncbi:unnamed protein product [Paramecium octaurelia]|uniref:Uncharacterized protein n=1 Tax=Paramecium octaurelia TaxID=43137 RepID=A0A8S1W1V9_PAROT|nr:unnamed protein product [Paramecium octaurelia]